MKVAKVVGGVAVLTGLFFLGRYFYKRSERIENEEQKRNDYY